MIDVLKKNLEDKNEELQKVYTNKLGDKYSFFEDKIRKLEQ